MISRISAKLWWTAGVACVAIALATISMPTQAADTGGIGGKPANPRDDNPRTESIFVYELQPGESTDDEVEIYNNSEQQKTIKVYSTDSIISSGGAFACAQAADTIKDVGNWIKLSKDSVTLAPSKSEKVRFSVTIPDYAEPGEHNGCIAIQEADVEAANVGNGIALSFRSAIRVAITVPGDIKKELTIRDVSLSQKSDKLVGTILLRNNGNVSLDTTVSTQLVNMSGTAVESINGTYPALPQTVTELNFEYKQPYWGGLYKLNVNAAYNANIGESLGEGGDSSSASASSSYVFITPRPLALLIELAVIISIGAGIYYLLKRYIVAPRRVRKYTSYIVGESEDIQQIANKFNTKWKHLTSINDIKPPYTIKPGDILKVPANKVADNHASNLTDESVPKKLPTSKKESSELPTTLAAVEIQSAPKPKAEKKVSSATKSNITRKSATKKTTKKKSSPKTTTNKKITKKAATKSKNTKSKKPKSKSSSVNKE